MNLLYLLSPAWWRNRSSPSDNSDTLEENYREVSRIKDSVTLEPKKTRRFSLNSDAVGPGMVFKVIGGLIVLVVGVSMVPLIVGSVTAITDDDPETQPVSIFGSRVRVPPETKSFETVAPGVITAVTEQEVETPLPGGVKVIIKLIPIIFAVGLIGAVGMLFLPSTRLRKKKSQNDFVSIQVPKIEEKEVWK